MDARCLLLLLVAADAGPLRADPAADAEFFEAKVRPLLVERCQRCHGEARQRGGLRLDSRAAWLKGGDSGPAVVPGKADRSLLLRMVRGGESSPPKMPPDSRLSDAEVAILARWIDSGAVDPRAGPARAPARGIDWKAAEGFWAYQPVAPARPPAIAGARTAIDAFVAARLKEKGLTPVAPASRHALLRRATFDLTGLPPTLEEVRAFQADASPGAFARVVDRLLASPRHGEHQARAWLDLARYGEDQADKEASKDNNLGAIPHAWRYRDWVVETLNADLPYDRFAKLQLAADLMEAPPPDLRALGFIGLGAVYARPNDLDRKRAEEWDDRLDTLTRTFLGLTVACARCHDHKYDPIPTQDYYSLAGVIAGTQSASLPIAPRDVVAVYDAAKAESVAAAQKAKGFVQQEIDRLAREKALLLPAYALASWSFNAAKAKTPGLAIDAYARAERLDPAALKKIESYLRNGNGRSAKLRKWEALLAAAGDEPTPEVRDLAKAFRSMVEENLLRPLARRNMDIHNGLFGEKGAFPLTEKAVVAAASAEWKARHAPLLEAARARAAAMPPEPPQCNGVADAAKPSDLRVYLRGDPAKKGEPAPRRFLRVLAGADAPRFTRGSGRMELAEAIADPANPLTARVMANRVWQQHFGRGIVATASNFGTVGDRPTHPELLDHLAARLVQSGWSVKRLRREIMLSDAYQRASSPDARQEAIDPENRWLWRASRRRLTVEAFRDSVLAVAGNLDSTAGGLSGDLDSPGYARRSVYGRVSRHDLSQLLRLFDFPAPSISSDRRSGTISPQQALFLMNSPFMQAQASALAARCAGEEGHAAQARTAYALALAREPTEAELALAVRYLSGRDAASPTRAVRFAQALLAGNEFFHVD